MKALDWIAVVDEDEGGFMGDGGLVLDDMAANIALRLRSAGVSPSLGGGFGGYETN